MSDSRPTKRLRTKTNIASLRPQPKSDVWTIKAVQLSGSELATVRVSPLITVKQLSKELKHVAQSHQVLQLVLRDVVLQDQKTLVEAGLHNQASLKVILVQEFLLAVALQSGSVKIFSAQTGELCKTLQGLSKSPFAPNSIYFKNLQRIVLESHQGAGSLIYKEDLSNGGRKFLMQFGFDLMSACLSQDGSLVAAGGNDGSVGIWSIDQMQVALEKDSGACFLDPNLREWKASSHDQVVRVKLSHDGELVATNCLNEDCVVLWRTDTGKRVRTIRKKSEKSGVHTLAFSPSGDILAILTMDVSEEASAPIELWSIVDGKRVKVLRGTGDAEDAPIVPSMIFSPSGDVLAVNPSPGLVDIFDLRNSSHKVLSIPCASECSMAFSADGSLLATASLGAGEVQIWCATTWDRKRQLHEGTSRSKSSRKAENPNQQVSCLTFAA